MNKVILAGILQQHNSSVAVEKEEKRKEVKGYPCKYL
jgi:hypothetical protein